VSELDAHSSSQAQEADLGTSPDAAVSEENQEIDFAADWQRTSRFDVAATQAHVAENTIVNCRPVVYFGSAPKRISRSFTRICHLGLEQDSFLSRGKAEVAMLPQGVLRSGRLKLLFGEAIGGTIVLPSTAQVNGKLQQWQPLFCSASYNLPARQ
jgi:hypothetical protein